MPRRLYLVRHGRADRDAWDGDDFDRPLTARGSAAAGTPGRGHGPAAPGRRRIVTSPLARAAQTAGILAAALDPEGGVVTDERLGFRFDLRRWRGFWRPPAAAACCWWGTSRRFRW